MFYTERAWREMGGKRCKELYRDTAMVFKDFTGLRKQAKSRAPRWEVETGNKPPGGLNDKE